MKHDYQNYSQLSAKSHYLPNRMIYYTVLHYICILCYIIAPLCQLTFATQKSNITSSI